MQAGCNLAYLLAVACVYTLGVTTALAESNRGTSNRSEKEYQIVLCNEFNTSVQLPTRTEVDCVSEDLAIEVDFSEKWAEAVGQSLYYASELNLRPGIILICKEAKTSSPCLRHRYLAEQTLAHWQIPATIWFCGRDSRELQDCAWQEVESARTR
ncbi:hypothetical protein Q669_19050 [Labrenzia sp. C1B10]|nr:hypothetical protein Q669_19050 [Labrenzia sp. C1B10]ERP99911.1 hypothetical protein Q675_10125 [Labrenzia sp. C1B70]